MMKFISVIIPCYNEEKYIGTFIESILDQDYKHEKMEVLIIDGISSDNTRVIIEEYCIKYPFIRLLDNPAKFVPHALNTGINYSKGEVIIRMDVHCTYPQYYFSRLVQQLFSLKADNVGGVLKILPAKESALCKSIAIGMSHKFGIGNAKYRVGAKCIVETDTVPFGCFRREIFDRIGLFDIDLIRNQDDEFNARIIRNGGKIFIIPDIVISYYARDRVSKLMKMYYQYGLFKPLGNKKLGAPTTVRQFFPFLFVLGLIIGAGLSILNNYILIIYSSVLLVYILLSLSYSASEAFKNRQLCLFIFLPYIFLLIHLSYGWGYIVGIVKFFILGRRSTKVNANR